VWGLAALECSRQTGLGGLEFDGVDHLVGPGRQGLLNLFPGRGNALLGGRECEESFGEGGRPAFFESRKSLEEPDIAVRIVARVVQILSPPRVRRHGQTTGSRAVWQDLPPDGYHSRSSHPM